MSTLIPFGRRLGELAHAAPNRVAVTDGDASLTRLALDQRTNRLARSLNGLGIKQGDLVSVALPNCIGFIEACYGLWKIGATPQPLSSRLPPAEAEAIMDLAETPILIAPETMTSGRPRFDVADLLARSLDDSPVEDRVAPHLKAPTSGGSTGRPKLILSGVTGAINPSAPVSFGIEPDDVVIMPAPIHFNGPFLAVISAVNQGAQAVLLPRFDPEATLAAVERHSGSWLYMVPTMMSRIWKLPKKVRERYDLSSLRAVWHMAAPCPPWLKRHWIDWLGPETIMELYSGTEGHAATIISGAEWLERPGSVGKVAYGEMKVFDKLGEPLPSGEIGEIYLRGAPGRPPSYQYRGATANTIGCGWETLGDLGYFDEAGYLFLADRSTDMILVGGANVYPAEVEAALEKHPLVDSSAVIGLPDEEMGSSIHAIIQAQSGLTEEALRDHVITLLSKTKAPRSYEFVNHNIRDDGGKVRRTQLREDRLAVRSTPSTLTVPKDGIQFG